MTAKQLVNKFYQPLGELQCRVSSDAMWSYAKQRALEVADMMIADLPMYVGELNPKWKMWTEIRSEILSMP